MGKRTRVDLLADLSTFLPDNHDQAITPGRVRQRDQDLLDSVYLADEADAAIDAALVPLQEALDQKLPASGREVPNGVAGLDGSGKVLASRIPSLPASILGSGLIDPARLPVLLSNQTIFTTTLSALTTDQQSTITSGTRVITSAGQEYAYKGSGSKTDVASYVVLSANTASAVAVTPGGSFSSAATVQDALTAIDTAKLSATLSALEALLNAASANIVGQGAGKLRLNGDPVNGYFLFITGTG